MFGETRAQFMQDSPPDAGSEVHLPVIKDHVYHCVCGQEYGVEPQRGGQCPFCLRKVSGEALQDAYEATEAFRICKALSGTGMST